MIYAIRLLVAFASSNFMFVAHGQEFPSRTLRIVIPYKAGGSIDVVARAIAPRLAQSLGQPVVIDNRAGASGVIGNEFVARASPDGYTIGLGTPATYSIPMALGKKLPYDPLKDFTPLAILVKNPLVIVVNASLPVRSLKELAEYGRHNPGKLTFGTAGEGYEPEVSKYLAANGQPVVAQSGDKVARLVCDDIATSSRVIGDSKNHNQIVTNRSSRAEQQHSNTERR